MTLEVAPKYWELFRSKDKGIKYPSFENGCLRVKIPFRYQRPICQVYGITPIRKIIRGDIIQCDIKFTGPWTIEGKTGTTWVVNSIEKI